MPTSSHLDRTSLVNKRIYYVAFRNPMKNAELKTTAVFQIISNTDANSLNLHIDQARKTPDDKKTLFNHILLNEL